MVKLFRCINAEHRKLWNKNSTVFCFVIAAILSVCVVIFCLLSIQQEPRAQYLLLKTVQGQVMLDQLKNNTSDTVSTADVSEEASGESVNTVSGGDVAQSADSTAGQAVALLDERISELDALIKASDGSERLLYKRELAELTRERALLTYTLENSAAQGYAPAWSIMIFCLWLLTPIVAVIAVVMASDMFAGEYERGTIGLMVCRPATRIKQYTAKIITAMMFAGGIMLTVYFSVLLTCSLTVSGGVHGQYIGVIDGKAYAMPWYKHSLTVLLCCYAAVAVSIFLCAAVGNLTHSRAASVAAALCVLTVSYTLGDMLASLNISLLGRSLFACLDLTTPLMYLAHDHSVSFADCAVLVAVHAIVFLVVGYSAMRRDID